MRRLLRDGEREGVRDYQTVAHAIEPGGSSPREGEYGEFAVVASGSGARSSFWNTCGAGYFDGLFGDLSWLAMPALGRPWAISPRASRSPSGEALER
jgi:hypothetical protein